MATSRHTWDYLLFNFDGAALPSEAATAAVFVGGERLPADRHHHQHPVGRAYHCRHSVVDSPALAAIRTARSARIRVFPGRNPKLEAISSNPGNRYVLHCGIYGHYIYCTDKRVPLTTETATRTIQFQLVPPDFSPRHRRLANGLCRWRDFVYRTGKPQERAQRHVSLSVSDLPPERRFVGNTNPRLLLPLVQARFAFSTTSSTPAGITADDYATSGL